MVEESVSVVCLKVTENLWDKEFLLTDLDGSNCKGGICHVKK